MEHCLSFSCDYLEGAHPAILQRLCETNFAQPAGYGTDEYCESAREKIRAACGAPNAEIHFLVGGTQTNATVIDALLRSYEGVIAADTGHISVHEAGAIEFGGHKVLTLPQENGKITASQIRALLDQYEDDANRDHTVMPGMVYLSQPTEYGTLYSKKELAAISALCREKRLPLYIDGARLAYALACPENDVPLRAHAALCDIFYSGGARCGALLGAAVVTMLGKMTEIPAPVQVDGDADAPYYRPLGLDGEPKNILKAKPQTGRRKCTGCGVCAARCPMGSISRKDPAEVTGVCIKCHSCVRNCPTGAKYFDDEAFLSHKAMLERDYTRRADAKIFL